MFAVSSITAQQYDDRHTSKFKYSDIDLSTLKPSQETGIFKCTVFCCVFHSVLPVYSIFQRYSW
jgi:hypothetical protein